MGKSKVKNISKQKNGDIPLKYIRETLLTAFKEYLEGKRTTEFILTLYSDINNELVAHIDFNRKDMLVCGIYDGNKIYWQK